MKKFKQIWMWMAIAVASFSFISCDDDDYWYDDYNHGGWGWNQGDWNNGLTALRMITYCRRLRPLQATGEAL